MEYNKNLYYPNGRLSNTQPNGVALKNKEMTDNNDGFRGFSQPAGKTQTDYSMPSSSAHQNVMESKSFYEIFLRMSEMERNHIKDIILTYFTLNQNKDIDSVY